MVFKWLQSMLGGGSPSKRIVGELSKRLGGTPAQAGKSAWRARGKWAGIRTSVTLDDDKDRMSAEAGLQSDTGDAALEIDPDNVNNEEVLLRMPMRVRLHVIEVVEAGDARLTLEAGKLRLEVRRAGLERDEAAREAATRLDVLTELAKFLPSALRGG